MRLRTRKSSWVKNSGPERRFYLNGQLLGSWLVPSARLTSPWPAGGELFLRRIDRQVAASPLIADNRRPLRIVAREPRLKSSFYACSWFCRPPSRPRVGGRNSIRCVAVAASFGEKARFRPPLRTEQNGVRASRYTRLSMHDRTLTVAFWYSERRNSGCTPSAERDDPT